MKNETDQAIDILLASYFAGEADPAERAQVEEWASASEANRAYFETSRKAWIASGELLANKTFDTDAAWRKLKTQMHIQGQATPKKQNYSWVAAAGVILIVAVASLIWWTRQSTAETQNMIVASSAEVLNDTLPDGSMISLNKNSQLTYPSEFSGEQREVTLAGEAFFEVAHDGAHPFVIETEMMDVTVLGTSFNVRAYPESDSVHVSVKTGKVQCVANGDTITVTPGEYAVYYKGAKSIQKGTEDNPNRTAYRDRIFRFNNVMIGDAVRQLSDAYGCTIVVKDEKFKSCRFTITKTFYNEPVENIIEAIEAIYPGVTSHTEGNTITLEGTGCN